MKGRRVYPDEKGNLTLQEGDYGKDGRGFWIARPPTMRSGSLDKHDVTEHEDNTITVSPSIIAGLPGSSWHGYLEKGVWRKV